MKNMTRSIGIVLTLVFVSGILDAANGADVPFEESSAQAGCGTMSGPLAQDETSERPAPEGKTKSEDLLDRVGILGASVSAGGGHAVPVAIAVESALKDAREVINEAVLSFGASPGGAAQSSISKLVKRKPSLVIGVDYFFWFVYGFYTLEKRKAFLAEGCRYLEALDCPIFLGDIPRMKGAGGAILALMIPPPEHIRVLNEQLRAWAAKRPNVRIMPLRSWISDLRAGRPLSIRGKTRTYTWDYLVGPDKLHPNSYGAVVLTLLCLDEVERAFPEATKGRIYTKFRDMAPVMKRLLEIRTGEKRPPGLHPPKKAEDPKTPEKTHPTGK